MKKAITKEEAKSNFSASFFTRYETLTAEKGMLKQTLQVNQEVENSDIHQLFSFYDQAFFDG
jgi:hypothetical protein